MPAETVILGIDPSTDCMGVALIAFDKQGGPILCDYAAISAGPVAFKDPLAARFARIHSIRRQLYRWVSDLPYAYDVVAFEKPFIRGDQAGGAIHQAIGAYLCDSRLFSASRLMQINTASVKSAQGVAWRTARGERSRAEAKRGAVAWAERVFGIRAGVITDAEADAAGVAMAAYRIIRAEEEKAAQGTLKLRQSRALAPAAAGNGKGKR
jgi:Holliday junction resolvasome RuvABC endonuclease subunit